MFEWILTSTLLILFLMLLRSLLGKHLSGRIRYALWLAVLFRLFIPVQLFSSPGPTALLSLIPGEIDVPFIQEDAQISSDAQNVFVQGKDGPVGNVSPQQSGAAVTANALRPGPPLKEQPESQERLLSIRKIIFSLYLTGVGVLTAVFLSSNFFFSRKLKRSRKKAACCHTAQLPVYEASFLTSPCLYGTIRPAIYITENAAQSPRMLHHVLTHEMTHYRHGDHIWSVLRIAALILHWYNPFVWWAAIVSKQDGEIACDEETIRQLGEGERRAYGETLLMLLTERRNTGEILICATTMHGDRRSLLERFSRICCKRKKLVVISAAAMIAVLFACVFLFSGAKRNGGHLEKGSASVPELMLDTVTISGSDEAGLPQESRLELPYFQDNKSAVLQSFNASISEIKADYTAYLDYSDVNSATLFAYPCYGESCVTVILCGQKFPDYGTDGEIFAFCYDFREKREISQMEALSTSGWTEDAMRNAFGDYLYAHLTDFGYSEDTGSFEVNLEIVGFRQRKDGGWDFFLRYQKPETGETDAWDYLLTFSDGVVIKGVAIPPEEIADIGCCLNGLVPYAAERRSVVMTADTAMAQIKAVDIQYIDRSLGEPETVAAVLNGAAGHVVELQEGLDFWWDATIYLSGGPDSFGSSDQHLWLQAGASENVVQVRYGDMPFYHTVSVEDKALYTLLRNAYIHEGAVDTAAAAPYTSQLNAHMEATLKNFQKADAERMNWSDPPDGMANYTDYILTHFQKITTYDDLLPNQVIYLYSFDYAITMEHPENMFWVGGNYLDGDLRMRGMDDYSYFAAAYGEDGKLMGTRFFWFDLFAGADEAAGEANARDTILYSFTHYTEEQEY